MDQMDVSVDVTVTQTQIDNEIIDDGVPMEDIDDMEIDFLFSKCDDLDLNNPKPNAVIELSDDDEKNEKIVPEDSRKYVQNMFNYIQNEEQAAVKMAENPLKFIKILPRPPDNFPKTTANSRNTTKNSETPLKLHRIYPNRPVMTIQPPTPSKRQFEIAIQSNIKIINNDLANMAPPTVNYTISTTPAVQPNPPVQSNIEIINNDLANMAPHTVNYTVSTNPVVQLNMKQPPLILLKNNDKPKLIQTQFTKGMSLMMTKIKQENKASVLQNSPILQRLLNPNNKTSERKPVSILKKVKPDNQLQNQFQHIKKLETPSTSRQTFSEPPKSDVKNFAIIKNNLEADLLNKTPEFQQKRVIKIKEEIPEPQDMIMEKITTEITMKEQQVSHAGVFKALHDASGAIVHMIEETLNLPNDEIQVKLETQDSPNVETLDSLDEEMQESLMSPDYPDEEILENLETLHPPDDEMQTNLMTLDYPDEEICNLGTLGSPDEEMQEHFVTPDYPDALEEPQEDFNFIDKKLLALTTVQLDDWSVTLSNSTRYCSLCQTLFPSRAVLDEHQAQWHPLLVPCVEEEGYYCHHCDTSFHDKYYLERHLRTHTNITPSDADGTELECFVCHVSFVSQHALHIHVNAEHVRTFRCHCGKEFAFQDLLDDHVKSHHARSSVETSAKPQDKEEEDQAQKILIQTTALFKCSSCEVHFTDYWKAKTHYAYCNKNNSIGHKCPRCPKLIARFDATHRRQHKLQCNLKTYTINSIKLNVISECPKCLLHYKILRKPKFTRHVKFCKGPSAEYVECCGLKLTEQRYLLHKNKHDTERDFIVLKYAFYVPNKNEGRLKRIENDTNTEPKSHEPQNKADGSTQPKKKRKLELKYLLQKTALFECETCKANFTAYYRAQKHYDQCTSNMRLRKCPYCPKFISSKSHMYQHRMRCKLKSYKVNAKQLRVLSECPKCRLHFRESKYFNDHVNDCRGPTKDYVQCCGYKFSQHQYSFHEKSHNDSDDREYIVLKYMLNVSREEKQEELQKGEEKVIQKVKPQKTKQTEKQEARNLECPICGLHIYKYWLPRHMLVHSADTPFKCKNCYFTTKRENDLKRHEKICRGNELDAVWYDCSICEYKTRFKRALNYHMNSHAQERNDSKEQGQQCPICGIRRRKLKEHMRMHSTETPFKCNQCYYSTKRPHDFTKHKNTCRGPRVNMVWYNCGFCEFKTRYKSTLHKHTKSHNSVKRDSAPEERKVQPRERENTINLKVKTSKQCPICGLVLRGVNRKRHMQVHNSKRPFYCDKRNCFFSTKYSGDLTRHKEKCQGNETNVIWYACRLCEFKSKHKNGLQHHTNLIHVNEPNSLENEGKEEYVPPRKRQKQMSPMKYECYICGLDVNDLQRHMLVHSSAKPPSNSERPFTCDKSNCFFSTKYSGDLSRHKANCQGYEANVIWYECRLCEFKAKHKIGLKHHTNQIHGREPISLENETSEENYNVPPQKRQKQSSNSPSNSKRPFTCDKSNCFFSTKYSSNLYRHKANCQGNETNVIWYACRLCDFKSKHKIGLKHHTNQIHVREPNSLENERREEYDNVPPQKRQKQSSNSPSNSKRPFNCDKSNCFFSTKYSGDLVRHKANCQGNETNVIWYACRLCDFKSKHKIGLKHHTNQIHVREPNSLENERREEYDNVPPQKRQKQSSNSPHISKRPFNCDKSNCFFSTKYSGDLVRHKANCQGYETNAIWYECRLCEFKAKHKIGLKHHTNQIHGREPISLENENSEENYNVPPQKRQKQSSNSPHISKRPFTCDKSNCFFSTKYSGDLTRHKANCQGYETNVIWYACRLCEFKSRHKLGLIHHTNQIHVREPNSLENERIEEYVPPRKRQKQMSPQKHECPICGLRVNYLKQHMLVHSSVRPFKCNKCYYSTKRSKNLITHQKTCRGIKRNAVWYDCSQCEFKTRIKSSLQNHINAHAIESKDASGSDIPKEEGHQKIKRNVLDVPAEKSECPICGLHFAKLDEHMPVHATRPFKCDKCYYSTKRPHHLLVHKQKYCQGKKINEVWYDSSQSKFQSRSKTGSDSDEHKVEPRNEKEKIKRKVQPKIRKCRICGRHVINLRKHMLVHSSVRPYKCDRCFFSTKRSYELTYHKANCQGNKINTTWYDCKICEFKSPSKRGLQRHTDSHAFEYNHSEELDLEVPTEKEHKEEPTKDKLMPKLPREPAMKKKCHVCGIYSSNLTTHMLVHSSERKYKCDNIKCYFSAKWSSDLRRHKKNCLGNKFNAAWYDCDMCEFKSTCRRSIKIHIIRAHKCNSKDIDSEEGEEVGTSIRSSDSIKHKKTCEETNPTHTVWHDCTICEFKTKCKQTMTRHVKAHGLESNNSGELDSEIPKEQKQEIDTRKSCPICGKHSAELKRHMLVHSSERPYKCDQCFFSTKRNSDLLQHKKKCRGTKINTVWYDCKFCEFKTSDKRGLYIHLACHAPERNDSDEIHSEVGKEEIPLPPDEVKPRESADNTSEPPNKHECHICGRHFSRKIELQKHILAHSSARPFKCEKCYYSSKYSFDIPKHKKNCKGIQSSTVWHDCRVCEFKTMYIGVLKRHSESHALERYDSDGLNSEVPNEEVLCPSDEVPLSPKEVPLNSEEVPRSPEDVPLNSEEVPFPSEEAPPPFEVVPVPFKKVPLPSEVPLSSEEAALTCEEIPLSSEEVRHPAEKSSLLTEKLPLTSEAVPLHPEEFLHPSKELPLSTEDAHCPSKEVPLLSGGRPLSSDEVPLTSKEDRVPCEEDPLPSKKGPVPCQKDPLSSEKDPVPCKEDVLPS